MPNLVTVQVGADGDIEVLADIFGYYEAGSKLAVSALSWSSSTVDASAGSVANMLTFTVTDSDPAATQTSGELEIRQRGTSAGAAAGGVIGAPLLWTPTGTPDSNDAEFLGMEHTSGRLEQVLVLGGTGSVSNGVEGALRSALS
jgi:hypothetical protein